MMAPSMDEEEFTKLTRLCRIACSVEERDRFLGDLSNILSHVDTLRAVDTEGVTPCHSVLETLSSVMRPDLPGELLSREEFLANAPAHIGGMVRVPPIMKEEE